jgi:hypothetical protein
MRKLNRLFTAVVAMGCSVPRHAHPVPAAEACFEETVLDPPPAHRGQFVRLEQYDVAPDRRSRRMTWNSDSVYSADALPAFWTRVSTDSMTLVSGTLPEWNITLARRKDGIWRGQARAISDAVGGGSLNEMRETITLTPRPCGSRS